MSENAEAAKTKYNIGLNYARGFCVFAMIFQHMIINTGGLSNFLLNFVNVFLLSGFFFLLGYTFKEEKNFKKMVKYSASAYLLPILVFVVIEVIVALVVLGVNQFAPIQASAIVSQAQGVGTGLITLLYMIFTPMNVSYSSEVNINFFSASWFLFVVFLAHVLFAAFIILTEKLKNEKQGKILQVLIVVLALLIAFGVGQFLPWVISRALVVTVIMYISYLSTAVYKASSDKVSWVNPLILISTFTVSILFCVWNTSDIYNPESFGLSAGSSTFLNMFVGVIAAIFLLELGHTLHVLKPKKDSMNELDSTVAEKGLTPFAWIGQWAFVILPIHIIDKTFMWTQNLAKLVSGGNDTVYLLAFMLFKIVYIYLVVTVLLKVSRFIRAKIKRKKAA